MKQYSFSHNKFINQLIRTIPNSPDICHLAITI